MDLGNKIRSLRERRGIEQLELADKINISQSKMNKIETGYQKRMEPEVLRDIAKALGVTTDLLLDISDEFTLTNKVTVAGQEINLSIEELKVFEELKKHPIMFNDLATDPETKVKELIKLYKMKKMFLEEDKEEYGSGFGELED